MDDRFLHELRRDPDPAFARGLRERLRRHDRTPALGGLRLRPVLAGVLAAAVATALFAFPSVRVSAQALLDLFRVRNFAGVAFDPARLEKLKALQDDKTMMVFDKQEILKEPGAPRVFATPQAAGAAAGFDVETPGFLPEGMALDSVFVRGEGQARLTADTDGLRTLLESLDLRDVRVPVELNGRTVEVRMPAAVIQHFKSERRHAELIQAPSPEVALPPGVDLAELAGIGLRILGLDRAEAERMARSVDWHTTLLVPVPRTASSFRTVEVKGNPGLLVTRTADTAPGGQRHRDQAMLLWSERGRVFAIGGDLDEMNLVQIAESVR